MVQFGDDAPAQFRWIRIVVAGNPEPPMHGDESGERVTVAGVDPLAGAAIMKTVAEADHLLRPASLEHRRQRPRDRHRATLVPFVARPALCGQRHEQARLRPVGLQIGDLKPR